MEYGICLHSVTPVRAEPSHKSELVTQILFGELYTISATSNEWLKIILSYDGYEGWIDILQASPIDEPEYIRLTGSRVSVTLELVQLLSDETVRSMIPVLIGSSLPGLDQSQVHIGSNLFFYDGLVSENLADFSGAPVVDVLKTRQLLVEDAMLYMNAPYLWGGRSPFGIDCSGFTQMVYKLQGIKLLRDASQQATQGNIISLLAEALPADLAFFENSEGNIVHVGMLIDQHRIIHCSGHVQMNTIDHEGIYNEQLGKYTHKLRLIRRII